MSDAPSFPEKFVTIVDRFSTLTGRVVSWLTLAMVVTTFLIVALRYVFNLGWIAMQESVLYMHASVFMLGAAWTLKSDGHVRVDIFYEKAGERRQALTNLLGTLFLLIPVCLYILVSSWDYVAGSWRLLEASREAGGLPAVFLLKTLIPLVAITLLLQGLAEIVRSLLRLSRPVTGEHG